MYKLIIIMLFSLSSTVHAGKESASEALTASLEKTRIQNNIPSMAVGIISAGEITYIKGFGFLDEMKTMPTSGESLFRIASISKLFTAQAIMQLVQSDKLALDDKIGQFLPTFKNSHITIKQLLTHSSGLNDTVKPVSFEEKRPVNAYLNLVNDSISQNIEANNFEYSDANFNILGAVISAVSGKKYEKYIYDHILKPAKMNKSNYFDGSNAYFAEAKPTYKGELITKSFQRPYDISFNPSEGLISNVGELSQWLKLTLLQDTTILQKQSYQDMLSPQVKTSWGKIYIGLGWQVYKDSGTSIARHPGSIRGYKSLVLTYPDNQDALILLTNSSNTPRWDIAKSITTILKDNKVW